MIAGFFYMSRSMYQRATLYSDIVFIDATYNVTDVGFKLVPIVGVDYRGKSVILAWAFVLYEDQISYEWLLEQFLSVVPHPPRTVVSDREQALISAVRSKCPTASHILCLWHVMLNIKKHLQSPLKAAGMDVDATLTQIRNMLYGIEDPEELTAKFNALISTLPTSAHEYMKTRIFPILKNVAWAYVRQMWNLGTHTSGRSENINKNIKDILGSSKLDAAKVFEGLERFDFGSDLDSAMEAQNSKKKQTLPGFSAFASKTLDTEIKQAAHYTKVPRSNTGWIVQRDSSSSSASSVSSSASSPASSSSSSTSSASSTSVSSSSTSSSASASPSSSLTSSSSSSASSSASSSSPAPSLSALAPSFSPSLSSSSSSLHSSLHSSASSTTSLSTALPNGGRAVYLDQMGRWFCSCLVPDTLGIPCRHIVRCIGSDEKSMIQQLASMVHPRWLLPASDLSVVPRLLQAVTVADMPAEAEASSRPSTLFSRASTLLAICRNLTDHAVGERYFDVVENVLTKLHRLVLLDDLPKLNLLSHIIDNTLLVPPLPPPSPATPLEPFVTAADPLSSSTLSLPPKKKGTRGRQPSSASMVNKARGRGTKRKKKAEASESDEGPKKKKAKKKS